MNYAKALIVLLAMFAVVACDPKNPAPAEKDADKTEKTEALKEVPKEKTADAGATKTDAGTEAAPKEKAKEDEKGKEKAKEAAPKEK